MADDSLTINIDELKVSEIEKIEEEAGMSIDELFGDGKPKGKALRVVGYVMKLRDDPTFTMEQAGDLVIRLADTNGGAADPS